MADTEQVKQYQRRTESGQVITVRAYSRTNEEAATQARDLPGRPPIAARPGQFAGGRSLPGVWVAPPDPNKSQQSSETSETSPEQMDEAQYGEELISRIIGRISPKTSKVVQAAARMHREGDDVVTL